MAVITTTEYIKALDKVLQERYPANRYSLNGYQECAVCLQYEQGRWHVFCGERGNRYEEVACDTILEACLAVIRKLTHRTEDISAMENELLNYLYENKIA